MNNLLYSRVSPVLILLIPYLDSKRLREDEAAKLLDVEDNVSSGML